MFLYVQLQFDGGMTFPIGGVNESDANVITGDLSNCSLSDPIGARQQHLSIHALNG